MGRYESKKTACNVEPLLRKAVSSDGDIVVDAGLTVDVDETILNIALEEALSNARKVWTRTLETSAARTQH